MNPWKSAWVGIAAIMIGPFTTLAITIVWCLIVVLIAVALAKGTLDART